MKDSDIFSAASLSRNLMMKAVISSLTSDVPMTKCQFPHTCSICLVADFFFMKLLCEDTLSRLDLMNCHHSVIPHIILITEHVIKCLSLRKRKITPPLLVL